MNHFSAKVLFPTFIALLLCNTMNATGRKFTLQEALSRAKETHAYKQLTKDSLINDLKHKSFRGGIMPNIQLTMKFPEYDKSISLVSQNDGSYRYRNRTSATSSLCIDISQLVPFTGGTLKYSMGLNRLDNLSNDNKSHSYYFNMGKFSYNQNLFSFNSYKWSRLQDRHESVVENIQNRQEQEKIKYEVICAFFDLLIQQQSKEVNQRNIQLSKYIFEKSKILLRDGRISELEYIDAKIEYMRDSIHNNEIEIDAARGKFRNLLQLGPEESPFVIFDCDQKSFHHLEVNVQKVLSRCLKYGYDVKYELREIQQNIEIKKAKAEKSPNMQLTLGGGYNTQFETFRHLGDDQSLNQNISVSISIPLYNGYILKNKHAISQIQLQKLNEQREYDKTSATIDIIRDLSDINIVIESINNHKETLCLLTKQIENIKLRSEYGRINMEQYIRLKSQYSQSYMTYLTLIKSYYTYIYKYRYLSLFDIESNEELYKG